MAVGGYMKLLPATAEKDRPADENQEDDI